MNPHDNPGILTFLRRLLYFSILLGLVFTGIYFLVSKKFITPVYPFLFLFFMIITSGGYYFLIRATRQQFVKFVNYYLLITALKLLLFIGVIFSYCLLNKADAIAFAASFFVLYFCYSVFEVVNLVSYSKSLHK
jgi:hypothetical protein